MNIKEYREKYGVEAYGEYLNRLYENRKRKAEGLPLLKKRRRKDDISVKRVKPFPVFDTEGMNTWEIAAAIREICDNYAEVLQKRLRKLWVRYSTKQNIIIVESRGKIRGKDELKFVFELYQLDLQDDEIEKFKEFVDEVIKIDFETEN